MLISCNKDQAIKDTQQEMDLWILHFTICKIGFDVNGNDRL